MNRPFDYLPYRKPDDDNPGDGGDQDDNVTKDGNNKEPEGKNNSNISEKAYKTLQTKYNVLYERTTKLEADNKELSAKIAQLELDNESKDRELETKSQATDTFSGKVEELTKTIETKDSEIKRLKLIMNEFPQLAEFEDTGVLPKSGTEEELRSAMKLFAQKIEKIAGKKFSQDVEGVDATDDGGSSASDGDDQALSYDDIYNQGLKLAGRHDPDNQDKFHKIEELLIEQEKERQKSK